jgi:alpha-D-ribose 1-methylphosphonate 5-triphosphate synthase subunit PhnI
VKVWSDISPEFGSRIAISPGRRSGLGARIMRGGEGGADGIGGGSSTDRGLLSTARRVPPRRTLTSRIRINPEESAIAVPVARVSIVDCEIVHQA